MSGYQDYGRHEFKYVLPISARDQVLAIAEPAQQEMIRKALSQLTPGAQTQRFWTAQ